MRPPRHAIVIGAGLAGCAIAHRLARRGWRIDLIDRHAAPAQEASGNPAGILLPRMAKDDALAARLSRRAYRYALHGLHHLPGVRWSPCGVFQIARDAAHEALQHETVLRQQHPADFIEYLDRHAAAARLGHTVARGGWWFPGGGWVEPASLCRAWLAQAGDALRTHFGHEIARIERQGQHWHALDAHGMSVATAGHLILANAFAATRLIGANALPLSVVRGQISTLPATRHAELADVNSVLCCSSYLTPPSAGTVCLGASFSPDDNSLELRLADQRSNLQRMADLLPGRLTDLPAEHLGGRVGLRTATPDYLPVVGALPVANPHFTRPAPKLADIARQAGLFALLGLGARGLVWAPLAAELLAAQLDNEPLPCIDAEADALDPARFLHRAWRRNV